MNSLSHKLSTLFDSLLSKLVLLLNITVSLHPFVLIVRVLLKLGINNPWLHNINFFYSQDYRRHTKSAQIFLDSMLKSGIATDSFQKLIRNSNCLEIGCGRYFGLSTFLLSLDAASYVGIDPSCNPEMIYNEKVQKKFILPAIESVSQLPLVHPNLFNNFHFSSLLSLDDFLARTYILRNKLESNSFDNKKFDMCFSISCLEHIFELEEAMHNLAKYCHTETAHVHVINFSNHLSKKRPFDDLYELPPDKFFRKWNFSINALRATDYQSIFNKYHFDVKFIPIDSKPNLLPSKIDSYWLENYTPDDLAIRTGIFVSRKLI